MKAGLTLGLFGGSHKYTNDKVSCNFYRKVIHIFVDSVLVLSAVDRGFEFPGQIKDYKIGICCFSTNHAVLRRKSKDWLAWNQDNVFDWGDMSILHGLLFQ